MPMGRKTQILAIAIASLPALCPGANAATESILYNFPQYSGPALSLLRHADGSFYGIANVGHGYGSVFQLRQTHGAWKERKLSTFNGDVDGYPGPVIEHDGVIYGLSNGGGLYGFGALYALRRTGRTWDRSILYSFTGGDDGGNPGARLYRQKFTGIFFGVAPNNFSTPPHCGSVFSIAPDGTEKTIHVFTGKHDGCWPITALHEIPGPDFTLAGITGSGGTAGRFGTVYTVTEHHGRWKEAVIYGFHARNRGGVFPSDLLVDSGGSIFGVTSGGGRYHEGTVFELHKSGSVWVEETLYSFARQGDGQNPSALCQDSATGALYGVAPYGGAYYRGILFQLVPSNGTWTETVLHDFGGPGDGAYPGARPICDPVAGVVYGTTREGGAFDGGVVYAVSLSGQPRH
jgi:hypothetical protein